MLKNKNFFLTVLLPVFISIIAGAVIIFLNNSSILKTQVSAVITAEKIQMNSEMSELKAQKKELSRIKAGYDKDLEKKRLLLDEIEAMTAELNDYTTAIESAKETILSLDVSISEKKAYNESLASMSSANTGGTKSYTNKKLNIPSDLHYCEHQLLHDVSYLQQHIPLPL